MMSDNDNDKNEGDSGAAAKNASGTTTYSRYITSSYPNFADEKINSGIMECLSCPSHITAYVKCFDSSGQQPFFFGAAVISKIPSTAEVVARYVAASGGSPKFCGGVQRDGKNDKKKQKLNNDDKTNNSVVVSCVLCTTDTYCRYYGISKDGPQIIAAIDSEKAPPKLRDPPSGAFGGSPWTSAALCCITCCASSKTTAQPMYFVCHICARGVRTALAAAKRLVVVCQSVT
jgi:hypothetical protein